MNYNRLKPYYIQAVVDGLSVFEVIEHSLEAKHAKRAIQSHAPNEDALPSPARVALGT